MAVLGLTAAAALTLSLAAGPASAFAASNRAASADSTCAPVAGNPMRIRLPGVNYYMVWNGVFKGQIHITGEASSFDEYQCPSSTQPLYQFQVVGANNLCLEYDGSDTAVIADTCTDTRASQQWFYSSSTQELQSDYNGCWVFVANEVGGANVNCNGDAPTEDVDWHWEIYPVP
jgi:hypothetical protein